MFQRETAALDVGDALVQIIPVPDRFGEFRHGDPVARSSILRTNAGLPRLPEFI